VLKLLDGLTLVAKAPIAPADNQVLISSVDAVKLNAMAVGDHTYLTIKDGRGSEIVKYTHAAPIVVTPGTVNIPVDRAQCGTTRRAWPINACLQPAISGAACVLEEFILQVMEAHSC
jgi:hypothetical protein